MKKQRLKARPSKLKPQNKHPGKSPASEARAADAKPRPPSKRIQSVTRRVGLWSITRRRITLADLEDYDLLEFADSGDMEEVQTDLGTLAKACDQIRDLAEEQTKQMDQLKARFASAESATKKGSADLVSQLGELERLLGGEVIPQALKNLCDQQLAAIDQRMAEMNTLEARVRELVTSLKP